MTKTIILPNHKFNSGDIIQFQSGPDKELAVFSVENCAFEGEFFYDSIDGEVRISEMSLLDDRCFYYVLKHIEGRSDFKIGEIICQPVKRIDKIAQNYD